MRLGTFLLNQRFAGAVSVSQVEKPEPAVNVSLTLPPNHDEYFTGVSPIGADSVGSRKIFEAITNLFKGGRIQGELSGALKAEVIEQTLRFTGHPEAARRYRERMG